VAKYVFNLTAVSPGLSVRLDTASGSTTPATIYPLDYGSPIPGAVIRSDSAAGTFPQVESDTATLYQKTLASDGTTVTATATLTGAVQATGDPDGGAGLAASAAFTGTYAQVVALTGAGVDLAGTTDSTAALNALLAANAGKVLRGIPGSTYKISAPLVVKSGSILDLTGCTVVLTDGSNCNMLQNAAVGTTTRILDAAMTASSAALASATVAALGTAAVNALVGQAVTVQGAGASGAPLTTTVSAVTGSLGTYGLTLAATASTTVSGQYAALGARDSDITVVGGLWNRGNNQTTGGVATTSHLLRFRHVDRLTVRDAAFSSSAVGSKYAVNPGDCTSVFIQRIRVLTHYSDGVHLNGPCARVSITDVTAENIGDDLVSITARDSSASITDCAGDITDVTVSSAHTYGELGGGLIACTLKVIAGKTTDASASYNVKRIHVRNITGPTTTAAVAYIGDTSNGNISQVTLDGVNSLGGGANAFFTVYFGGAVINDITLRRVYSALDDSAAVTISANVTAGGRLVVEDCTITTGGGSVNAGLVYNSGVMTEVVIDKCIERGAAGRALFFQPNGVSPKPSCTRVIVTNSHLEVATGGSGSGIVRSQDSAATVSYALVSSCVVANSNYALGMIGSTCTIFAKNIRAGGASASSWIRAVGTAAVLTVYADGLRGTVDGVTIDTSSSLASKGFGLRLDVGATGLSKTAGDTAYNTDAARSCGVGPVVSDGTNWKGLFSGATF
jgi:hypothetical protein